jgi:hypothetical protein
MKYIFIFFSISVSCLAQKKTYSLLDTPIRIDSVSGGMIYTQVVEVEKASGQQLYNKAKLFIQKTFISDSPLIIVDDKESGLLSGKGKLISDLSIGNTLLFGEMQMQYEMIIEIRVKDGRYRYEISNIEIITQGYRARIDESFRKNPEASKRKLERALSEKEFKKYTGESNPIIKVINQLKTAMKDTSDKNDF